MSNRPIASFARIAALVLPASFALGCAGYATVDGYDAEYVDPPPPAVVETPSYRVSDGYIYEANGHYYHQHAGRWVTYRRLPHEAVRVNVRARARY
ncbi:MAG TPA: hypothetical protein VK762_21765 [Polyangiaceae bacterium]|jgi:hypothetical protein|nr:hypothetical protein [Polyangiaceae bacterium]